MIRAFLSRPNWVPSHVANHLNTLYLKMVELGFETHSVGKSRPALVSPFDEVVSLMDTCDCTVVLGLPQIQVASGKIKNKTIDEPFSLPTEWNQIEAAISIMLKKPTLMMLHRGVATRGLFEQGAANVFVYDFHTLGPKWVEDTIPKLSALKEEVERRSRRSRANGA